MSLLIAGLQGVYFAWAKLWIRHVLYEALICEMQAEYDCKSKALEQINTFLPIQDRERPPEIKFTHIPFRYSGEVRVYLNTKMWAGGSTTLKSPRGGFVYLPFLIPLAVVLFVSLSLATLFINERAKQMQICRDAVLDANQKIEDGIQKILDLNPRILMLQIERDALEAAARADPEPYSQAAIQAKIKINQAQQMWMKAKQNLLKQLALVQSRIVLGKLQVEARSEGALNMNNPRTQLDLQAENTWHTAKQQSRSFDFSNRHKIRASWKVSTRKYTQIFNALAGYLDIGCASTIRREGLTWVPMLAR